MAFTDFRYPWSDGVQGFGAFIFLHVTYTVTIDIAADSHLVDRQGFFWQHPHSRETLQ